MTETFVEGIDVARRFQQGEVMLDALQPASFTVRAGDRIAIVGPSGSGKSTLLQIIADLDTATSGQVRWPALGVSGALRPQHIGIVFQSASLLPTLSAAENVEVPLRLLGGQSEPRQSALKALDSVGLAAVADKLPDELSGGQAQRVGLARAIALRPRLVLADEPTGQLDQPTAQLAMDALLRSLEGTEAALVVATHDLAVAQRLQVVWRMDHGVLTLPATGSTP
ncbi:MAG: ABC transporter ATP-binding protein [Polaromonas sp. 39-63-203]|jgi:putative ABC transport system ATP-binding protein/lipoprotein-releasing system ATP-binding protein|uniref:ABC transporter ATP-binding protein n=1 Tax=Polaromonas sp. TaxID=1869339 RepID=UPI000BCC3848|nr:ATP-binding cassette domain-containing protein [Polaromonas sp.]OYY52608.1 MAG: ABC transporter ATP-binding protein [Polaromonas sp. 35-63-240]OYZ01061.1 MAG: ABC transporter ATP-binding protein [Polaromonas sp. 28-63-22]OYZ83915.1 MAG: ABC transporter ATP-binding protein [Polaromonas sp. 24-62-144]OZB01243.1 MAG: ABC transporter ATP-binding protein [Polaromonas sp. 39-63-203]HQS33092.1 ATP-binding cassette domain-containing protein [Polaromonas sp.]